LIGDTITELDSVLAMFASLTRISQIEANDRTAAFRTVNLTEIASEVVELFDAAAEEGGVDLHTTGALRPMSGATATSCSTPWRTSSTMPSSMGGSPAM